MLKNKIIWLTGNSGSGKTTLAKNLIDKLKNIESNIILLDGDEMRIAISEKSGFSKSDREEHNLGVARLAKVLSSQGFDIIVSVIAPFQETRDKIDKIINPLWIYIKRDLPKDINKPYEIPNDPDLIVDNDRLSIEESVELIYRKIK